MLLIDWGNLDNFILYILIIMKKDQMYIYCEHKFHEIFILSLNYIRLIFLYKIAYRQFSLSCVCVWYSIL